jgi:hypothetical protein
MIPKDAINLDDGFPLEVPQVFLPWHKPLCDVAATSGGFYNASHMYCWKNCTFFHGLQYTLASEVVYDFSMPFERIIALVDHNSEEFDKVGVHLAKLFGNADLQVTERDKRLNWRIGKTSVSLSMFELVGFRCHLVIANEPNAKNTNILPV